MYDSADLDDEFSCDLEREDEFIEALTRVEQLEQKLAALDSLATKILRASFHGDQWPIAPLLRDDAEELKAAILTLDEHYKSEVSDE